MKIYQNYKEAKEAHEKFLAELEKLQDKYGFYLSAGDPYVGIVSEADYHDGEETKRAYF